MPKLLVANQLVSLAQLLVFTLVRSTPALFASFGFAAGEQPALAGFLLFQNIIGPLDEVGGWAMGGWVNGCWLLLVDADGIRWRPIWAAIMCSDQTPQPSACLAAHRRRHPVCRC
jgi:hypothetical protein